MRVLLVAKLEEATGNDTTIRRIRQILEDGGHQVSLLDSATTEDNLQLLIESKGIESALGIHAHHSGKTLRKTKIPYSIILGGTDVNEIDDPLRTEVIGDALSKCCKIVAFHEELRAACIRLWSQLESKIVIISPSPSYNTNGGSYNIFNHEVLRPLSLNRQTTKLFLLPCSIRPVKDPLYLVEAFSAFHLRQKDSYLVIVGPDLDKEYAKLFKQKSQMPGILRLRQISIDDLQDAMRQAYAIVNSSISEGLCNTIMEALVIGCPVMARSCKGNTSIIKHKENGILFEKPEEFVDAISLLEDESFRKEIIANGKRHILNHYNYKEEERLYCQLMDDMSH